MVWDALGCFGMLWDALGCFGVGQPLFVQTAALRCFGVLWDALGCFGLFLKCLVVFGILFAYILKAFCCLFKGLLKCLQLFICLAA